MNSRLKVNITPNNLSNATKEQMWNLYRKYYHYTKVEFLQKMEKNNYYSFYTINNQIVGFTGLRINHSNVKEKKQLLIYFGQTVIDEKYRGQSLIPVTGAKLCLKYWKEMLFSDVYFWADALTYKAYLVFAKSVAEMYPSRKQKMSSGIKSIIDYIGDLYYSKEYCQITGTVQKDKVLVNDITMQIPQKYIADKDIHFYAQANPLFKEGHGLITITPMNRTNIGYLFSRYIRKMVGWKVAQINKPQVIMPNTLQIN